ncbi:hypothetical protein ABZ671_18445 [Micromonospora sp. NPDC006766]|uniref:hypothetical protein n=1 Tax=Micromonospora sp. NPDC006766 TaxID=3154778 RepID=UPI003405A0B6
MFGRTPQPPPPPRRRVWWPLRALGALIGGIARAITWIIRLSLRCGWRYRQLLAPLYASLWLAIAALLMHGTNRPWLTISAGTAIAAVYLALWIRRRSRQGRRLRRAKLTYAWSCLTAAAVWSLVLTTWTLPLTWTAGIHTALTIAAAGPWMWDRRVRRPKPPAEQQVIWAERLAAPNRRLAGTELVNVKPGKGNIEWEGVIHGEPGLFTTSQAVAAQEFIGSAFRCSMGEFVVEPEASERLDTARIMRVNANKTYAKTAYDDTWRGLDHGSVALTTYPDGTRGRFAIFVPKAGTVNSVFAGDSGSGKSKGFSTAITQVTDSGLVVPWAACPQGGQSFPAWAGKHGQADYIARDAEQCLAMLEAFRGALFARSAILGELPFLTSKEKVRHGIARYDPDILVLVDGEPVRLGEYMPILSVSVDEIPVLFAYDPDSRFLVAQIVKLDGKVGGQLNLGVQMPSVPELGNNDTIRQNIKGNVVAFRNTEAVSKGMILSPHMPSPDRIPVHPPGQPYEHTKGTCVLESVAPHSARATFSRTPSIADEDDFELAEAAAAHRPALDEITARGAGRDYYDQWLARPLAPKAVRPDYARTVAEPGTPAEPAPAREVITVQAPAGQPPAVVPAQGGRTRKANATVVDQAVDWLQRNGGVATTSVIATGIGSTRSTVSTSLGREAKRPGARVRRGDRDGEWALAGQPARQLQEVA